MASLMPPSVARQRRARPIEECSTPTGATRDAGPGTSDLAAARPDCYPWVMPQARRRFTAVPATSRPSELTIQFAVPNALVPERAIHAGVILDHPGGATHVPGTLEVGRGQRRHLVVREEITPWHSWLSVTVPVQPGQLDGFTIVLTSSVDDRLPVAVVQKSLPTPVPMGHADVILSEPPGAGFLGAQARGAAHRQLAERVDRARASAITNGRRAPEVRSLHDAVAIERSTGEPLSGDDAAGFALTTVLDVVSSIPRAALTTAAAEVVATTDLSRSRSVLRGALLAGGHSLPELHERLLHDMGRDHGLGAVTTTSGMVDRIVTWAILYQSGQPLPPGTLDADAEIEVGTQFDSGVGAVIAMTISAQRFAQAAEALRPITTSATKRPSPGDGHLRI